MNSFPKEPLLQLALKNGDIVHVKDVENGKKCNCICPRCQHPLIAKNKGQHKVEHFAHATDSDCIGAVETILHSLSKEILKETKTIFIPDYRFYYTDLKIESTLIKYNKLLTFDSVKLEEKILVGNELIIVDALCEIDGKQMIVEFAKSHFIDDTKNKKLIALGIACIEIPIAQGEQNKNVLAKQLHSNFFKTSWIVNKKGEAQIEPNRIKLLKEIEETRKRAQAEHERKEKAKEQEEIRYRKAEEKRLLIEADKKKDELTKASKKGNLILKCPIRNEFVKQFGIMLKDTHNIIPKLFAAKEISRIYDHSPDFVDIFIDKERVILIPPGYHQLSATEKAKWNSLFKIVTWFLDYRNHSKFNPCNYCKCFKGNIYEYIICTYDTSIPPQQCFKI